MIECSSKSDIADCEPSFFIGRIPVIYAAANILGVVELLLKSIRKNSRYSLELTIDSRMGASHSSIIITIFLPVFSTALISV